MRKTRKVCIALPEWPSVFAESGTLFYGLPEEQQDGPLQQNQSHLDRAVSRENSHELGVSTDYGHVLYEHSALKWPNQVVVVSCRLFVPTQSKENPMTYEAFRIPF